MASRLGGLGFSESSSQLHEKIHVAAKSLKILHSPMYLTDQRISSTDFSLKEAADDFSFSGREDVASHKPSDITILEKSLNTLSLCNSNRRVCVSAEKAKNSAEVENQQRGKSHDKT